MTTKKPIVQAKVDLLSKNNLKTATITVSTTTTDTAGNFIFRNIRSREYSLSCFYKMHSEEMFVKDLMLDNLGRGHIDSNFNVQLGHTYTHTFYLMVACPYDSTKI